MAAMAEGEMAEGERREGRDSCPQVDIPGEVRVAHDGWGVGLGRARPRQDMSRPATTCHWGQYESSPYISGAPRHLLGALSGAPPNRGVFTRNGSFASTTNLLTPNPTKAPTTKPTRTRARRRDSTIRSFSTANGEAGIDRLGLGHRARLRPTYRCSPGCANGNTSSPASTRAVP